jgi:transposase InsO family protein
MNLQEILLPEGRRVQVSPALSREARHRLKWMDYYLAHERNARLTCRHFGISSATFYRWWRRFNPRRLESLEDDRQTRRPRRVRQPHAAPELVAAIRALREQYPRWGKLKLVVLLRRHGWTVSASTVGRTLTRLRRLGQLREPPVVRAAPRRHPPPPPYAQRLVKGYAIRAPGDLVQVDTTFLSILKARRVHFTARDVVSRKDVVCAYDRASSQSAARFLREELPRLGFAIRALQIDGGSEFKAGFEQACQAAGILLFVLPPRSPKLNGHVERAHRTYREEFYDLVELPESLAEHNALLRQHEDLYNNVRPHQALGFLAPNEYLQQFYSR